MSEFQSVELSAGPGELGKILLPSSKSVSNRALIIKALEGGKSELTNLSEARDTQLMMQLLDQDSPEYDAKDAGTTMRFLTAYLGIGTREVTIRGTERMHSRPIEVLVDALNHIGGNINYMGNTGYPPLRIHPFSGQKTSKIDIPGNVSSQYISALMMVAPALPEGLHITITGKIGSWPYIRMTVELMTHFGISPVINGNKISINHGNYNPSKLRIEPDWSAASYWYSMVALSGKPVMLEDVSSESFQGDRRIVEMMEPMGVQSEFTNLGLALSPSSFVKEVSFDFTDTPDLAQTIAVICAVKGIKCHMTGLESLRIKETDRIAALQNELHKFGGQLKEDGDSWLLIPSDGPIPELVEIDTYEDHRMAMAFAPLATKTKVVINDPKVVRKSYPRFWDDLKSAGFTVNFN